MTWLQQWTDVLMLHYAAPERELRRLVPWPLEIDVREGTAWLSFVFFRLHLRAAGWPSAPGFSSLVELNLRTYVRHPSAEKGGREGIYFLRMYADNRLAIAASKVLTPLCYELAAMGDERGSDGKRNIACHPHRQPNGRLDATISAAEAFCPAEAGTLDAWLVERYRLFVVRGRGEVLTANVEHLPWQIAEANVTAVEANVPKEFGFGISNQPEAAHVSPGVAARFGGFERVQPAAATWEPGRAAGRYAVR